MKTLVRVSVLGLLVVFLLVGCAKKPEQAISDSEAAVAAVTKEGADVYANEELKKLNDDMTAAMDEVTTQSKKFIKKYGNAKEMLAKVNADAEALKTVIPARKEEAKNNALTALNEARAAVDEAKALIEKAPKGKGTRADIAAFKADIQGLEDSLPGVQQAIDSEDYFGAKDKATSIKDKAAGISEQINQAIAKVKK